MGEALARTSRSKIAAGVRGDNWSEGRLRCRWTFSSRLTLEFKIHSFQCAPGPGLSPQKRSGLALFGPPRGFQGEGADLMEQLGDLVLVLAIPAIGVIQ